MLLAVALALMVLVTISVTVFVAIVGKAYCNSHLARVRVSQRATRLKKDAARKADGPLLYLSSADLLTTKDQMTGWCVALGWSCVILIGSHQTYCNLGFQGPAAEGWNWH